MLNKYTKLKWQWIKCEILIHSKITENLHIVESYASSI